MKIKNLTVDNKYVHFVHQQITLDGPGVYRISGANGVGKTTLLEKIVFGNNEAEFKNQEYEKYYKQDRQRLFAYVPQDIPNYKEKVSFYLNKGCEFEKGKKDRLFSKLRITDISDSTMWDSLSGGEQIKVAIASAFLKDTPYVFLDEPTNHLDNDSTKALIEIIEEEALEKTIVIVSHDNRLQIENQKEILIENGNITQAAADEVNNCRIQKRCPEINRKLFKSKMFSNKLSLGEIGAVFILSAVLMMLILLNHSRFITEYSYDNGTYTADNILTYTMDYYYDDLNSTYAKAQKLNVDEALYSKYLGFEDIEDISKIEGVKKIYIVDYYALDNINQNLNSNNNGFVCISLPHVLYVDFYSLTGLYLEDYGKVVTGRYPEDNADEICIPYSEISNLYSDFDGNLDEVIGLTIEVSGKVLTVVGITDGNRKVAYTSYTDQAENLGIIEFDDEFKENIEKYRTNDFYADVKKMLIVTEDNKEKQVLNQLILAYPGTNYISKGFSQAFEDEYNKTFITTRIIPFNLIVTLIISIVLMLIEAGIYRYDKSKVFDFQCYYVNKRAISAYYARHFILRNITLSLAFLAVNIAINNRFIVSTLIIIVDEIILNIPTALFLLMKVKNDNKNFA